MAKTSRYETEVEVRTADGQQATYSGDGVGPAGMSGDDLLGSAEAAALREAGPGAEVIASRARKS